MANVTARSCLAMIGVLAASSALAQMPRTISYQGVITNSSGVPLPNNNHKLVLSIYDQSAGGGALFTETQTVPVVNGTFNVIIGSGTNGGIPVSLAFDRQYWLGISVDDSPTELAPRTHLTASPYSFSSMWADSAHAVAANAITAGAIQNGAITLNKLNIVGSTNGQVLTSTGNAVGWKSISQLGVSSLNGQIGDLELLAGNNTLISKNGNKLTIGTINSGTVTSVNSADAAVVVNNPSGPSVSVGIAQEGITENLIANNSISGIKLKDGSVTSAKIVDGTIATVDVADNAITSAKIADATVATADLSDGSVTLGKIAPDAVNSGKIADGTVATVDLADASVTTAKLVDGSVTSSKIPDGSITTAKLVDGAVTTVKLADGSVNSAKIADGAIVDADVSLTAAIAYSKIAGTPTSLPPNGAAGGDLTGSTYPNPVVANSAINSAKIADGTIVDADVSPTAAIAYSKIAGTPTTLPPSGAAGGDLTGSTYPNPVVANDAISSAKIADGTIVNADISPTAAIAYSKIAGTPTTLPPSGAAGGDLTGTYPNPTVANGTITSAKIADGTIADADVSPTAAIAYSKIAGTPTSLPPNGAAGGDLTGTYPNPTVANGTITSAKIADGTIADADVSPTAAIAYSKIAGTPTSLPPNGAAGGDLTGTYPNPTVANGTITSAKIADGTIVDADVSPTAAIAYTKIAGAPSTLPPSGGAGGDLTGTYPNPTVANDAITSAKIADGSIVNADISPTAAIAYSKLSLTNSIVTSDLTNGSVTTVKLADSAVSGLKLGTAAVNTAHIADGAVTDAKVANGISYSKLSGAPTSLPPSGAAGGDLTGTYPNPTVANNAITSAKILDGTIVDVDVSPTAAIAYSKLALTNSIQNGDITANAITTSKVANGTVTTSKLADSAVSGLKLLTFAVTNRHLADNAVTLPKIDPTGATTGQVIGYNGSTVVWSTPPTGATGAAGGDLTGTYPNPVVAANAITSAKILDGTIANSDISAAAAISYSKLNLTGSLQGSDIAAGTFTTTNAHHAIGNNDNTARELRLLEPSGSGVNFSAFKSQAQAGDITYTLPNAAPTGANQVLQVQAVAGNNATLAWGAIGGNAITFSRSAVIANAGNTTYNVQAGDDIVGVDMSAGTNFTVNLPPATSAGKFLIIKIERYNNALLPVLTIQPNGTDKIDGNNNLAFGNAGGNRRLYSDGAGNWYTW